MYLLFPVFNVTFYGIVDSMLLDAHSRLVNLASTMDIDDFNHVNYAYLPRAFGSGSQLAFLHEIVPVPPIAGQVRHSRPLALMPLPTLPSKENPTEAPLSPPPSTRIDFDVSQYLVDKSPIIGSGIERPFDQYGSLLSHETSPCASPSHPFSTEDKHPLQFEEGGL